MTTFKGHKTGFNRTGSNSCIPNPDSITTNFKNPGRVGMPGGKPAQVGNVASDTSNGNRRLAKTRHGDGGGSGANVRGTNAFTKGSGKRK